MFSGILDPATINPVRYSGRTGLIHDGYGVLNRQEVLFLAN